MTAVRINNPLHPHPVSGRWDSDLDDALLLEPAGNDAWRVCDSRIVRGEGRFLAFVEAKNGTFEVLQLADDFVWTTFPTMHAALTHVVRTNADRASAFSAGELAWIK